MTNYMNQIFRNAIIYSIGNYSSKLIAILIFPIVVTYLGLENTGKLDLITSTVAILTTFFSLNIGDAIYRWFQNKDIEEKQMSFSNGLIILLIMLFIVSVLYIILHMFYIDLIEFLTISFFILVSQIILSILMHLVRGEGKVTSYTSIEVIKSILFTLLSLAVVIYTEDKLNNIFIVFVGTNIVSIILAVYGMNLKSYYNNKYVSYSNIKKLISYSIPLTINTFSWLSFFIVNKYIILYYIGLSNNGVFAIAEKFSNGIFFLGIFYFYSLQDYCLSSLSFQKEKFFFVKIVKKVIIVSLIGIVALVLCSWVLMPIFFPKLVSSLFFLPWLALAKMFIVLSGYLGIPYNYKKETLSMSITTFSGVVISVLLSLVLINYVGVYGVCFSILAGSIFVFIVRLKYAFNFFNGK